MAERGPGQLRRLALLADWDGHVQLLAADQAAGEAPAEAVAVGLSGQASGVLLRPEQWPSIAATVDRGCAAVLVLDEAANLAEGPLQALRAGATAIAFRLSWPASQPEAERTSRLDKLAMLGDECAKQGLPLLVVVDCPPADDDPALAAAVRSEQVLGAVRALAAEDRQIDLLAVPLPADLRYTAEYAAGALDGTVRDAGGSLAEVEADLAALDAACATPWLLLAEGSPEVWLTGLRLAVAHGACGYLASRETWSDAPAEGLANWLAGEGLHRWRRAIAISSGGQAWMDRPAAGDDAD